MPRAVPLMRTYRAVTGDGSGFSTTSHPDAEVEKHALFAPLDHPPGLLTGTAPDHGPASEPDAAEPNSRS